MKVPLAVVGGRDFSEESRLAIFTTMVINQIVVAGDDFEIVSGTFPDRDPATGEFVRPREGADQMAIWFAIQNGFPYQVFAPDFARYGTPKAYHVRNSEIVNFTAARRGRLLAFWDGRSGGTKSTIQKAISTGLRLDVVSYEKRAVEPDGDPSVE